jgi:hypothetical protein
LTLTHVAKQDIDEHWDRVRAGLERILRKYEMPWKPEHAYVALATGTAYLSLIGEDGFLIWARYPGDDMRGLVHVWCLEGHGLAKHQEPVRRALEDLARTTNCRAIRIIGRKGWGRDGYWKHGGHVFEHEVTKG